MPIIVFIGEAAVNPAEEERGISLLEAIAYASSDDLATLEGKIDRLVARVSKLPKPGVGPRRKIARLILGARVAVSRPRPKKPLGGKSLYFGKKARVFSQWLCFAHHVTVRRRRETVFLLALVVDYQDRSVLGLARVRELSQRPEIVEDAWPPFEGGILTDNAGSHLYAWAQRVHNDRVATPTPTLRAWAELTLFKWKGPGEAFPVEVV